MSRARLCGMTLLVLLSGGCGGRDRATSPVAPVPDSETTLPESNIPRGIGVDPPGGGPAVPPGPDPDAPVILDVTINRTPLPANAWAELHAVSNVSLTSHAWHLGPNAVTRSYSTFASLPIKTLQPGLQRGWVEGWDAQGRRAMREFELEVAHTPNAFIGVQVDKTEVAVGEEFDVEAIIEGPNPEFSWTGTSGLFEYAAPPQYPNPKRIRLRAIRPGVTQLGIERQLLYREPIRYLTSVRVTGPPMLIYKHQHDPLIGEAGKKGDMHWLCYGDADAFDWDFEPGATRLLNGPINLFLQLHAPGLYTGQARAHGSDGWSEWQPVPFAVGRNWAAAGTWHGRSDRVCAVSQGRLWIAEAKQVHNAPGILTIKSTDAALPFSVEASWDEVTLSIPKDASLVEKPLDGCGRPMFVLQDGQERGFVAPTISDPQGADDWWMRWVTLPRDYNVSGLAGCPQRLAVATYHRFEANSRKLFDLPMGMLLSSETPLDLINGDLQPALDSDQQWGSPIMAMPDGVGGGWRGDELSAEMQFAVNAGGTISEYTLILPSADNGYRISSAMVDGRLFLTGITRQWWGDQYPAKPVPRFLMRTGSTLPRSASDWEELPYPEHLKFSVREIESYPGTDHLWIGGLGIAADVPTTEFADASQWIPVVVRTPRALLDPKFAFGGRLYRFQAHGSGSQPQYHDAWSVGLD